MGILKRSVIYFFPLFCSLVVNCMAATGQESFQAAIEAERRGDADAAITQYTSAIQAGGLSNDQLVAAYSGRGNAYHVKKDYERAIQDYGEAIRINPKYARAYSDRGGAYLDKKEYDRAIRDLNEAIR